MTLDPSKELNPDLTSDVFVGRNDMMASIHKAITASDQLDIISIHGEGGMGKTSVLKEVGRRYKDPSKYPHLLVLDLIDFFDIASRTRRGFMLRLFEALKQDYQQEPLGRLYQKTHNAWVAFARTDGAGTRTELWKEKREELKATFQTFYNELARTYRIVIPIDTFELVQHLYGEWLAGFLANLPNTVVLIAGRKNNAWYQVIRGKAGNDHVHHFVLEPFDPEDTRAIFKMSIAGQDTDPEERRKIQILANGRPILITMALDCRRQGITLKHLTRTTETYTLDQLTQMDSAQLEQVREEFEKELVTEFQNMTKTDIPILLMALIPKYFTARAMVYFLDYTIEKAEKSLKTIANWTFMKYHQKDDSYQLHDLVRDLINKHVWPDLDPAGILRKRWYERAVGYYDQLVHDTQEEIDKCLKEKKRAEEQGIEADRIGEIFHQLVTLRWEKRLFEIQKTYYDLLTGDPHAEIRYRNFFADLVWGRERGIYDLIRDERANACAVLNKVWPETHIRLEDARIAIVAENQFDKGLAILESEPLNQVGETDDPILYALIQLYKGIAFNYKGDTRQSEQLLTRCIEVLKKQKDQLDKPMAPENIETLLVSNALARAYANLGYMHLVAFRYSRAIGEYKRALHYARLSGERSLEAAIMNDLGFIYPRLGKFDVARKLCKDSLKIRETLGQDYFTGLSYNILSRVEFFHGKYEAGIRYAETGLEIFERIGDLRGKAMAHCRLGANQMLLGKVRNDLKLFDSAKSNLKTALASFTEKTIQPEPWFLVEIYEYLGLMYQGWGAILVAHSPDTVIDNYNKETVKWFQQGIDLCRDKGFSWMQGHLMEHLISFYLKYLKKMDAVTETLLKDLEAIVAKHLPADLIVDARQARKVPIDEVTVEEKEFCYLAGKLYRDKARIAFHRCLDSGDFQWDRLNEAARYYTLSCAFMEWFARSSSFGMETTLKEIIANLEQLPPRKMAEFRTQVETALKEFGLVRYRMILERIEDYTGIM